MCYVTSSIWISVCNDRYYRLVVTSHVRNTGKTPFPFRRPRRFNPPHIDSARKSVTETPKARLTLTRHSALLAWASVLGHRAESSGKCPFVCTCMSDVFAVYSREPTHWRRRQTRASSASGRSSVALLMARKAPSYTNFSYELCYFEHERGVDVSPAARCGAETSLNEKKRPSTNYTVAITGR